MLSTFTGFILLASVLDVFFIFKDDHFAFLSIETRVLCYFDCSMKQREVPKKVLTLKFILSGGAVAFNLSFILWFGRNDELVPFYGVICAALLSFLYSLYMNHSKIKPIFNMALIRESLAYSVPLIPYGLSFFIIAMADKFLIAELYSKQQAGHYRKRSY